MLNGLWVEFDSSGSVVKKEKEEKVLGDIFILWNDYMRYNTTKAC